MKRRSLVWAGLMVFVAIYAAATFRVLLRSSAASPVAGAGKVTVRFAHFYLEPGLREAYAQIAADYMRLHPEVEVQQIAVPQRIFNAWAKTQLIGGTAPDLVLVDGGQFTLEDLARHFTPLHEWVESPNPYNAGTPAASLPWRETFIDGLTGSYDSRLLSYYSIPTSLFTNRVFYNRSLWREIFGTESPPADYEAFRAACVAIEAWGAARGQPLVPLAGSVYNAPFLIDFLFGTQTQRRQFEVAWSAHLRADLSPSVALLQGRWGFADPALQSAFHIVRDIGRHIQPGFLQLQRDDANFAFLQGRTVMLASGAHEAASLRAQAEFPLGVFALPVPGTAHPAYGAQMLGPVTEANIRPAGAFGLTRASRNPAQAVDFLRYLTSQAAAARFAALSGWLTAVADAPIPAALEPFRPVTAGFANGFDLSIRRRHPDAKRVADTNLHLLLAAGSDEQAVAAYTAALDRDYRPALRLDLESRAANTRRNVMRQDGNLAAYRWLSRAAPGDAVLARKFNEVAEQIDGNEAENYFILHELARTAAGSNPPARP